MIVLGINEDHNASCAIVVDGEVVFAQSEERITRVKNDVGYPYLAIEEGLKQTGIKKHQVDFVVFSAKYQDPVVIKIKKVTNFKIPDYLREMHEYWKPILLLGKKSNFWQKIISDPRFNQRRGQYYNFDFLKTKPQKRWAEEFNKARVNTVCKHLGITTQKIIFADHHLCHASYAYFASPIKQSKKIAVVTADSWGDGANATIFVAQGGKLQEVHRTSMCNLARIYRFMTLLLGMRPNEHEYKVMGLAPYAKDYHLPVPHGIFKKTLEVDGIDFRWREKPGDLYFYFKERLEGIRFDAVAGALQKWLEELVVAWIANIVKKLKVDQLAYSGGLSLNVKANQAIAEMKSLKNLFVPPSGGDESSSIGAAYWHFAQHKLATKPLSGAYLGYKVTEQEVDGLINKYNIRKHYQVIAKPSAFKIAQLIAEGRVLARCVGKMEFGARALGNRSILADPSKLELVAIINQKIKYRDFWMPFTPTILDKRAKDYLVNPKKIAGPYMTLAFGTTDLGRDHLKAAIHPADLTARPQILDRETNPSYYELILAFEKLTGIGAVLNTSFNLHGEPIVRNAEDAYYTFINSGLDGIIFENHLILKRSNVKKYSHHS